MPSLPWFQFYANDWLADPAVRCCSLAARGLWMDLIAYCHLSPVYGKLLSPAKKPYTAEHIARLVGAELGEVSRLLEDLEQAGVFGRETDGTIYCRRMVRDSAKREKCSEAGKRGGNRGPRGAGGKFASTQRGGEEPTVEEVEAALEKVEASLPGASKIAKPEAWAEFEAAWKASGLPGHDTITRTPTRVGWWQQRQADEWWRNNWRAAVEKAATSPRCMGQAPGNWCLRPEMLLKIPDMAKRILDGEFNATAGGPAPSHGERLLNNLADALNQQGDP